MTWQTWRSPLRCVFVHPGVGRPGLVPVLDAGQALFEALCRSPVVSGCCLFVCLFMIRSDAVNSTQNQSTDRCPLPAFFPVQGHVPVFLFTPLCFPRNAAFPTSHWSLSLEALCFQSLPQPSGSDFPHEVSPRATSWGRLSLLWRSALTLWAVRGMGRLSN